MEFYEPEDPTFWAYNDNPFLAQFHDERVIRNMAESPFQGMTRDEYYDKRELSPYRLPTLRELATGRSHNLYLLGDGLVGLMPFPV